MLEICVTHLFVILDMSAAQGGVQRAHLIQVPAGGRAAGIVSNRRARPGDDPVERNAGGPDLARRMGLAGRGRHLRSASGPRRTRGLIFGLAHIRVFL